MITSFPAAPPQTPFQNMSISRDTEPGTAEGATEVEQPDRSLTNLGSIVAWSFHKTQFHKPWAFREPGAIQARHQTDQE